MILLDTDHLSIVTNPKAIGHAVLFNRLDKCGEPLGVPVVCVEEQCQGWLAKIRRSRDVSTQIRAYERFVDLFHFFRDWEIVSFDMAAADILGRLRGQRIRIGSQDLKISAIALSKGALLLSANLRHFSEGSRPAGGELA